MKSSLTDLFRSAFGPKDEKFRQKLSIFFVCLVISVIIWFSIKMSNEYDTVVEIPLTFTNLPKNKVLTGMSDSLVQVEILEKGIDLFRRKYIHYSTPATISLRNLSLYNRNGVYEGIVHPSAFISDIEHEHDLLGKVLSVKPDSIYLTFESQRSKKLPVKASMDITFEKQYMLYGGVVFEPDCVVVKGPSRLTESLDSAFLGSIVAEKLSKKISFDRYFDQDSVNRFLEFSPQVVRVSIPVEKYTESETEADIKIVHSREPKVKLFPDKVKVYYKVALKDFSRIEPGMISVVADFSDIDYSIDDKVRVKLESWPDFIQISRIEPEKAEFIIIR